MCVCVTRGTGPELVQLIKAVEKDMESPEKGCGAEGRERSG